MVEDGDVLLKRIEVTHRPTLRFCVGCVFNDENDRSCLINEDKQFPCEVNDNGIIRRYIFKNEATGGIDRNRELLSLLSTTSQVNLIEKKE